MLFDMPLEQLKAYLPPREEPPDFDAFWQETLAEARGFPLNAVFEPVDFGLRTVETFDVTFNGYDGQPIKGWLLLPRQHHIPAGLRDNGNDEMDVRLYPELRRRNYNSCVLCPAGFASYYQKEPGLDEQDEQARPHDRGDKEKIR